MNTTPPPITHPDARSMQWTPSELRWIEARDAQWMERITALEAAMREPCAWPVMPPSKGQSPVLFEDGYAEGWAKCISECKKLFAAPPAQPAQAEVSLLDGVSGCTAQDQERIDQAAKLLTGKQPQAEAVPTIYVSKGQLDSLKPDPEDEAGTYLPVRKSPKGKFTHPLFAAPKQAEPFSHATQLQIAYIKGLGDGAQQAQAQAVPQGMEVVGWEYRWFDPSPYTVTSGKWSEWERVVPRNPHMGTAADRVREIQHYIDNGMGKYEIRALYAAAPSAVQEIRCEEKLNNGGVCPRHNLQCGWPKCNEPAPQPKQAEAVPPMFGGGLVAIKTLLSRDPCAHANVAIKMIDEMLAAAPQPKEQSK